MTSRRRAPVATVVTLVIAALGIGAFASFRLWQARAGDPLVWQDSLRYEALGNHPLLSHWLWAGNRPVLTPLFWKLSGSAPTFVMLQTLVSVTAWSLLAVVVAHRARARWAQVLGGAVVLGFAATRPITQWDRSVLSESLSLSALALLFAVGILWAARPTVARGIAFVAVALLFAAARDTQIWVVALVALAVGVDAVARRRHTDPASARVASIVAFGLVGVVAVTAVSSMVSHRDVRNVQNAIYARVFPYVDRVRWFSEHGMPQADRVVALARATKPVAGVAPVVSIDLADPKLQPLARWLRTDAPRTYLEWLLLHPGTALRDPLLRPERTYNNAEGRLSFYAATDRTDAPLLTAVLYPSWGWVLAGALLAGGAGFATGTWRRPTWRMVALLGGLGLVHMLIAWHGDGMETTRHASVGNVQVRLGILVLLVMLLERRPRRGPDRQPEVSISPK